MWFCCIGDQIKDKVVQLVHKLATRAVAESSSRFHDADFDLIPVWRFLASGFLPFPFVERLFNFQETDAYVRPFVTGTSTRTSDRGDGFPNIGRGTRRQKATLLSRG